MIISKTTDPILVKKISVRLWALRDEIEWAIDCYLRDNPNEENPNLNEILKKYGVVTPDDAAKADPTPEASADGAEGAEASNVIDASDKFGENPDIIELEQNTPDLADEKFSHGKVLLTEIYMDKMIFFCDKQYIEGQSVMIEFLVPKRFVVSADIIFCNLYNLKSRIISMTRPQYRAALRFTFNRPGERALLRQFLESIEVDKSKYAQKVETTEKNADDDDLTDLL